LGHLSRPTFRSQSISFNSSLFFVVVFIVVVVEWVQLAQRTAHSSPIYTVTLFLASILFLNNQNLNISFSVLFYALLLIRACFWAYTMKSPYHPTTITTFRNVYFKDLKVELLF
jgi:hypothetical protein